MIKTSMQKYLSLLLALVLCLIPLSGTIAFADIPVAIANHNVTSELKDFVAALDADVPCATDVYQGTRTVAFADAAIRSAASGRPEPVDYNY